MTQPLHSALKETLHNWLSDLPDIWQTALAQVQLNFESIDPSLTLEAWEPIFPVRKGRQLPGMPKGSHIFKAFDDIEPHQVRCVILGQDPYPSIDIATGRAFEVGNIAEWRELNKMFTKSIRAWVQMTAQARTGDASYGDRFANWPRTLDAIEFGALPFESPADLCNRWHQQGVLLLNTSLTLSRFNVDIDPHQARGHLMVWKPLIQAVLRHLLSHERPLVVMGFGASAAEAIESVGMKQGRQHNTAAILREHPANADAVLAQPNPFVLCNTYLAEMACFPISW